MRGHGYFGADNPFTKDQIGAMLTEQFIVGSLAGTSPDAAITVLPVKDRQGRPLTNVSGNAWAIPKAHR